MLTTAFMPIVAMIATETRSCEQEERPGLFFARAIRGRRRDQRSASPTAPLRADPDHPSYTTYWDANMPRGWGGFGNRSLGPTLAPGPRQGGASAPRCYSRRYPAIGRAHDSLCRASRTHASAAATSLRLAPCMLPRLSRTSSNATRACCSIQRSPRRTRTPGVGMVSGFLAMVACQSMRETRIIRRACRVGGFSAYTETPSHRFRQNPKPNKPLRSASASYRKQLVPV
jgi:hypothetical protein